MESWRINISKIRNVTFFFKILKNVKKIEKIRMESKKSIISCEMKKRMQLIVQSLEKLLCVQYLKFVTLRPLL